MGADGHYHFAGHTIIQTIDAGSPAEKVGLAVRDTIISVNGMDSRAGKILYVKQPVDTFAIRIRRAGGLHDFTITSVVKPSAH